ncbi:Ig-like domain-containing protein [Sphingomicrobium sp. XHP0235]|uniref:Ig-like domain-containing protein n=1 Tax=Sphingomicrobium aquimarinum TaxID=3133971 RepID=UPI0031FE7052
MTDAVGSIDTSNADSGAEAVETEAVTETQAPATAPTQAQIAAQAAAMAAASAEAAAVDAEAVAADVDTAKVEKVDAKADKADDADEDKADAEEDEDVSSDTTVEDVAVIAEAVLGQDMDGDGIDDDYEDCGPEDNGIVYLALGALAIGAGVALLALGGDDDDDVIVTPINVPPTAADASITVTEDTTATGQLTATDPDSSNLTYTLVGDPIPGLTLNSDGSYSFNAGNAAYQDLDTGESETIVATFQVSDGQSTNNGTLTITVNGVTDNFAPVANADTATTAEDTAVTIDVLANDTDADADDLTITAATVQGGAAVGTVTINDDGTLTFNPAADFNGTAVINYTVSDGMASSSSTATVVVTPVDDVPVIGDDLQFDGVEDTDFNIDIRDSIIDVDGDDLTITAADSDNGTVIINEDGTLTFIPDDDFEGAAVVNFTVTDGTTSQDGSFTVNVAGVNDAPVAMDDALGNVDEDAGLVTGNVLDNDLDVDGDTLTVSLADGETLPPGFTVNADGSWSLDLTDPEYQMLTDGETMSYSFDYVVMDGNGGMDTATVSYTVVGSNDAPTVVLGDPIAATEDTAVVIDLSDRVSDAEGDMITIVSADAVNGTVVVNADGTLSYTPDDNYFGADSLTVVFSDGTTTTTETFIVDVASVNDAPVAMDDMVMTDFDTAVVIDVLANDMDDDNDMLSISAASSDDGTVVVNDDGTILFTPNAGFEGDATISYTVVDGQGGSDTATVTVSVAAEMTVISLDQDDDGDPNTLFALDIDASDDAYDFVDDASVANLVSVSGFGADDTITFTSEQTVAFSGSDYDGDGVADDVQIIINNNGQVSEIYLYDVITEDDIVFDAASAEAAIGDGVQNFFFEAPDAAVSGGAEDLSLVPDQTFLFG